MTGLLTLRVDAAAVTPAYEQLRSQLADYIASGAIAAGERLPPIRQLAGDLRLAAGTVAHAYSELEAAGLVRTRRGGGTRVAETLPTVTDADRHALLEVHARAFARQARLLGVADTIARDAIAQALVDES